MVGGVLKATITGRSGDTVKRRLKYSRFEVRCSPSDALSVGHNPYPFAGLVAAKVGSSQHSPSRIKPHLGQVTEDDVNSPNKESCDVLHEDVARFNFANDAGHFLPQPAPRAFDAFLLAAVADVLARKAARYQVNKASPRSAVKTAHVRPNRESWEGSIGLSLRENLCGVGATLNGADGAPSQQVAAEYSATSACEKSQLIHVCTFDEGRSRGLGLVSMDDALVDPHGVHAGGNGRHRLLEGAQQTQGLAAAR